ncbi:MAG TPA: 2-polyprenyl-3-methyl-6-methoxy-1,4-benzoquinone monooxygenase [Steroidobacteraceae bacterium]|nr:2-polyprenyl-3-methyl-6-methoxy-1,4-benzoquinone monooxygenase [Steroidobacteraceae bacterium]
MTQPHTSAPNSDLPPTAGNRFSGPEKRDFAPVDRLVTSADQALRTIFGVQAPRRPNPAGELADTVVAPADRREVARLMRINHSGEVAAQALYAGQALTARGPTTQAALVEAAQEETDHLAWCAARIQELHGRKSILNPLWYAGSFAIGAVAGFAGDRTSLGFVAETERQVGAHLDSHLRELPAGDARTRAILEQMREDEARHGENAANAGGNALPMPVRVLMKLTSKIMTRTAYWL